MAETHEKKFARLMDEAVLMGNDLLKANLEAGFLDNQYLNNLQDRIDYWVDSNAIDITRFKQYPDTVRLSENSKLKIGKISQYLDILIGMTKVDSVFWDTSAVLDTFSHIADCLNTITRSDEGNMVFGTAKQLLESFSKRVNQLDVNGFLEFVKDHKIVGEQARDLMAEKGLGDTQKILRYRLKNFCARQNDSVLNWLGELEFNLSYDRSVAPFVRVGLENTWKALKNAAAEEYWDAALAKNTLKALDDMNRVMNQLYDLVDDTMVQDNKGISMSSINQFCNAWNQFICGGNWKRKYDDDLTKQFDLQKPGIGRRAK